MRLLVGLVFLIAVAIFGVWGFLWPASLMRFRRRRKWPETLLSGGFFYATEKRTETICVLLAIVSLLGAARIIYMMLHSMY
jgi:hypothetical protein